MRARCGESLKCFVGDSITSVYLSSGSNWALGDGHVQLPQSAEYDTTHSCVPPHVCPSLVAPRQRRPVGFPRQPRRLRAHCAQSMAKTVILKQNTSTSRALPATDLLVRFSRLLPSLLDMPQGRGSTHSRRGAPQRTADDCLGRRGFANAFACCGDFCAFRAWRGPTLTVSSSPSFSPAHKLTHYVPLALTLKSRGAQLFLLTLPQAAQLCATRPQQASLPDA